MPAKTKFRGSFTALVTPFSNGSLDEGAFRGLAQSPGNLDEVVAALVQHQYRTRRGTCADPWNASARKTRLEGAAYPLIAF